jgi:hypothetical protein
MEIFSINAQIQNFMKIRPVESTQFRGDKRRETMKLVVAIRTFTKAPKTGGIC